MKRTVLVAATAVGLLGVSVGPALAVGTPQRPAGPVVTYLTSVNGGDNGWGNCGHNSSGGAAHSGMKGSGGGNGGYRQGDACGTRPVAGATGSDTTPANLYYTVGGVTYEIVGDQAIPVTTGAGSVPIPAPLG